MSNFFLRSRHYLLFIFLFIPTLISIIFQVIYNVWLQRFQREAMLSGSDPFEQFAGIDLAAYHNLFLGFLAVSAVAAIVQYGWYWSVGTKLHRYLPEGTDLKPQRFKTAWTVGLVVQLGALVMMYFAFGFAAEVLDSVVNGGGSSPLLAPESIQGLVLVGLGYGVAGMIGFVALVYVVYYVGRTIRSIEYNEPRRGSDALGFSVLSYFLFIGIWFLQPKINRLVDTGRIREEGEFV